MQIDFHHAATYVVARYAGFVHADAATIAHAAQYVDDSTSSGCIRFDNGMRYHRYATAHPMADPDNLDNDESMLSWLPFHFLPGNDCAVPDPVLGAAYISKLVCRPDSAIARAMIRAASDDRARPHGLHRLGIAAHVFIDTFAHQGFAGLHHEVNRASDLRGANDEVIAEFPVPPIGHGQVGTCPDQPFLRWSYRDWNGVRIYRDNPADFLTAACRLCEEFQRYRDRAITGLTDGQKALIDGAIRTIASKDGALRHRRWLQLIADGHFGFEPQVLEYDGKATGSWKHQALGDDYANWITNCRDALASHVEQHGLGLLDKVLALSGKELQSWQDRNAAAADKLGRDIPIDCRSPAVFLTSDYRRFHDAAKAQRQLVLGSLLSDAGIIAS